MHLILKCLGKNLWSAEGRKTGSEKENSLILQPNFKLKCWLKQVRKYYQGMKAEDLVFNQEQSWEVLVYGFTEHSRGQCGCSVHRNTLGHTAVLFLGYCLCSVWSYKVTWHLSHLDKLFFVFTLFDELLCKVTSAGPAHSDRQDAAQSLSSAHASKRAKDSRQEAQTVLSFRKKA